MTAGAGLAGDVYTRGQTVVAALDAGAGEAATEAAAIGAEGFSGSGVIRGQARAQAAAIAPMANSAAGMRLMVSTMDTNMAAMQQQLKTTSIHNQVSSARLRQIAAGYRTQTDFLGSGEEPATGGVVKDAGFGTDLMPEGIGPPTVIDPDNPFVGDERFGHWQNYTPPPHVGDTPPPPFEHRSLEGLPAKEGGPSGFYTPGRTWLDDSSAPWASLAEQYKFRISGEDLTSYTRTVTIDGHQQLQRWVGYTYEAQRTTQVDLNGDIWAKSGPDEAQRALGGTTTGGIGGLVTPPKFGEWQPITPNQMANLSTLNPHCHVLHSRRLRQPVHLCWRPTHRRRPRATSNSSADHQAALGALLSAFVTSNSGSDGSQPRRFISAITTPFQAWLCPCQRSSPWSWPR